MKESENLKPTESTSLPEVTPEEEKKIVSSLKSESFSFVPDQLNAIMARCHIETSVAPETEKEVTGLLKEESASFVPDKLQDVMKAVGVSNELSEKEQEDLVKALEGETSSFVPNDLGAVKKATGTYNPYLDQEALATQEKIHNEGAEVVPNVEKKVYEETGAKKHFSFGAYFKKHWIPLTSGFAVAAAAVAVIVVVPNLANQTSASGTYVSVTITPASSLLTTGVSGLVSTSVEEADAPTSGTTYSLNRYTPSWSFLADSSNLVMSSTFAPKNYSGELLATNYKLSSTITNGLSAQDATAKLVAPSYQGGYLQNVQNNNQPVYNQITINVFSTDSSYSSNYETKYRSALTSALTSNQVYANVSFNVTNLSSEFAGVSTSEAQKIINVCTSINEALTHGETKLTVTALKKEDTRIIDALDSVLNKAAMARMTSRGLVALKEGLYLSLQGATSTLTAAKESDEIDDIKNYVGNLPWCYGNEDQIRPLLNNEGYYLVGEAIRGTDSKDIWNKFADVRDYIISVRTKSTDDFVSLLGKTQALVEANSMPDGYSQEKPDDGQHQHGDPGPGDWHGGVGDFGPGGDGPR